MEIYHARHHSKEQESIVPLINKSMDENAGEWGGKKMRRDMYNSFLLGLAGSKNPELSESDYLHDVYNPETVAHLVGRQIGGSIKDLKERKINVVGTEGINTSIWGETDKRNLDDIKIVADEKYKLSMETLRLRTLMAIAKGNLDQQEIQPYLQQATNAVSDIVRKRAKLMSEGRRGTSHFADDDLTEIQYKNVLAFAGLTILVTSCTTPPAIIQEIQTESVVVQATGESIPLTGGQDQETPTPDTGLKVTLPAIETLTPEPTAKNSPTETLNPILKADLILSGLPAWARASVVQVNGDYLIRDINNTVIARWNGTEWKDKKPIFYECGQGGVRQYYDGLPSGINMPEFSTDNGISRQFQLSCCLLDVRESNEDDPVQTGFVIKVRIWESYDKFKDYPIYIGLAKAGEDQGVSGFCLVGLGAMNCEGLPNKDVYKKVKEIIDDPKRSKQVVLGIPIEDLSLNLNVSESINEATERTEKLYKALDTEGELPDHVPEEGPMLYAGSINVWQ